MNATHRSGPPCRPQSLPSVLWPSKGTLVVTLQGIIPDSVGCAEDFVYGLITLLFSFSLPHIFLFLFSSYPIFSQVPGLVAAQASTRSHAHHKCKRTGFIVGPRNQPSSCAVGEEKPPGAWPCPPVLKNKRLLHGTWPNARYGHRSDRCRYLHVGNITVRTSRSPARSFPLFLNAAKFRRIDTRVRSRASKTTVYAQSLPALCVSLHCPS